MTQCTQCHEVGKQISGEKCLACHTILNTQVQSGKGLHANPSYQKCEQCHIEHHGRDFDLIFWNEGIDTFNHDSTGYALNGRHRALACRQCHSSQFIQDSLQFIHHKKDLNRTYLGLSTQCQSCHEGPHRNQFKGKSCNDCHGENSWNPQPNFSHNQSQFKLTGKHQETACEKCHRIKQDNTSSQFSHYKQFTNIAHDNCTECHQDIHHGKLGPNCRQCHTTRGWNLVNLVEFDHNLTGFVLKGKHQQVDCKKCHKPGIPLKIDAYQHCTDCHSDYHEGCFLSRDQYQDCSDCHSEDGFSPSLFSIGRHNATRFPLTGGHQATPCIACHQKNIEKNHETTQFDFPSFRCQACHKDPHWDLSHWVEQKGCEFCHTTQGWHSVQFDHTMTQFSLTGQHQYVQCEQCHKDKEGNYRFAFKEVGCVMCHDDVHQGQFQHDVNGKILNQPCDDCHTTTDWLAEKLDHTRDSAFPLSGRHRTLNCDRCHHTEQIDGHLTTRYKPILHQCDSCHGLREVQDEQ